MRPQTELNFLSLKKNIPLSATVELTRRCPYSCLHCYLPETRGLKKIPTKTELTAAELGRIFGELRKLGAMSLALTGGEPFLREDLPEICALAVKHNLDAAIYTSLYPANPALLEKIRETGLKKLEISLYGRKKVYERVTGKKNSFKTVMENLKTAGRQGFKIKIKTPLLSLNGGEIRWLRSFCERNSYSLGIDPQLAPGNDGSLKNLSFAAKRKDLESLFKKTWFKPEKNPDGAQSGDNPVCGAGRNVISIDPYGNVYPCLQLPLAAGNVKKETLSRIWKESVKLEKLRRLLSRPPGECLKCALLSLCPRCPGISYLRGGDPRHAYEDARLMAKISRKMI